MGRLTCLCPGCRRTTANPKGWNEWICGKHWSAVPRNLRRRRATARRRARRDPRWQSVEYRLWLRCREAAIDEALMGFPV